MSDIENIAEKLILKNNIDSGLLAGCPWADSVIKSRCPCVCMYVCTYVPCEEDLSFPYLHFKNSELFCDKKNAILLVFQY